MLSGTQHTGRESKGDHSVCRIRTACGCKMYVWCAFLTYNNDLDMLEFSSSKCWHASRYMAMARVCVHHFIRNAKLVGYNGCGRSTIQYKLGD